MSQKTIDGKTDCREEKKKGSASIRFHGKNPEIIKHLEKLKEDHPCFRITINNQRLEEKPKEWKSVDKTSNEV